MTIRRVVEIDDVRDELPDVIAIKGENYVYKPVIIETRPGSEISSCMYWDKDNQTPSCLVGYYLIESLGVPSEIFEDLNTNCASLDSVIDSGVLDKWLDFSPEAVEVLQEIQDCQDAGKSWGQAYEAIFGPKEDDFEGNADF